jgi:hypothetical protein
MKLIGFRRHTAGIETETSASMGEPKAQRAAHFLA